MKQALCMLLLCGAWLLQSRSIHAKPRRPTHDFELYDLADRLVKLERIRSRAKLVIVDFFSLSCRPCREALPAWRALLQRFHGKGLALIIVAEPNRDQRAEELAALRALFRRNKALVVVVDKYGLVAKRYRVIKGKTLDLPRAFLVDGPSGRLLAEQRDPNKMTREVIRRMGR